MSHYSVLSKYGNCTRLLGKRLFLHIKTGKILNILSALSKEQFFYPRLLDVCRILHGKCLRTVFTHELLMYQKSNEWASASNEWNFWYKSECVNTIQSTFHVVLCLLHTYWDTHHFASLLFQIFQNPKISRGLRPGSKVNDWQYPSLGDLEKNEFFPKGKSWGFLVP